MSKPTFLFFTFLLVVATSALFFLKANSNSRNPDSTDTKLTQNVNVKDGVQYVVVQALGGYWPRITNAKADIPTKLIIKTDNTYDCSASVVIRSIGFRKILPKTGEETIDLGNPQTGRLQGLCSMGMYSFIINFI
jgi:plastocyanin domain-containing protein